MLRIECVASTEEDRLAVARTLADPSYQAAYQARASMQDMRSGTARVSAHGGVRQVRAQVQVVSFTLAGVGCEWILPPSVPVPAVGQPFLVYLHGGGFVRGSLDLGRANASELACQAALPVLAVGYRQAPEHPYPAAPDDVATVDQALEAQGHRPEQRVWVGESAGGSLALTGLFRRSAHGDLPPAGVVAISPMADLGLSGASWHYNAGRDVADLAMGRKLVGLYLGDRSTQDPDISPVCHHYTGACPLLLMVGSHETMLSDVEHLARRAAIEVPVDLAIYEQMVHGFTRFKVPVADRALAHAAQWSLQRLAT